MKIVSLILQYFIQSCYHVNIICEMSDQKILDLKSEGLL